MHEPTTELKAALHLIKARGHGALKKTESDSSSARGTFNTLANGLWDHS